MLIPHYWAEARAQTKTSGRQVTVRRWGWSDASQAEAQALADRRVREAMDRILAGEDLRRREARGTYGTEDGVPIREEVVARHGNSVITRNSYGSLCLNTPDVFFADVDAPPGGQLRMSRLGCLLVALTGLAVGLWQKSILLGVGVALGIPWLWAMVVTYLNRQRRPLAESQAKAERLAAIRAFAAARPEWHLRVYETPAGYRLLALHDVFDPQGEPTREALRALGSDERFANLCVLQSCFRARVSPKPWRMGYHPKESLPKSKWPFPPEHLARRRDWIAGYDALAPGFASCRFVERLGSEVIHVEAAAVRELHDRLCQAESPLPLA